jgi:AraC family transcriptional regulator of adaptative response/methylated-DNA-[protein]-cysteine methyltransferase
MNEDEMWELCLSKDTSMDGVFVVAVRTTGIYCRPSCSARKPKRENVLFLADCDAAEAAGFRACKRCNPRLATVDGAAELVRRACEFLEADAEEALPLPAIARRLAVSAAQLQRTFKRGAPP